LTLRDQAGDDSCVFEQVEGTRHFREEGPTLMNSTAAMPMPMRLMGTVAPAALVAYPWHRASSPVSAGFGLGFGSSFVCVTTGTDLDQATEINTKAHGARRLQETST
jgi:hypothetical protein